MSTLRQECLRTLDQFPGDALIGAAGDIRAVAADLRLVLRGTAHEDAGSAIAELDRAADLVERAVHQLRDALALGRRYAESI